MLVGLTVGYLGYYLDVNKKKGMEPYLVLGVFLQYISTFIINFLVWSVPAGEINYVAIILGSVFTYSQLRLIDYFFHL